jgi:ABC-type uncharacterized transport system ATPase subunit
LPEGVIMGLIGPNGADKNFFDRGIKNLMLWPDAKMQNLKEKNEITASKIKQ